jgi:hypothetical protein
MIDRSGTRDRETERRPNLGEYAIILVIIAGLAIAAWVLFGDHTSEVLQTFSHSV